MFLESVCIVDQILEICVLFSTILKVIRSEATSVFLYISCTLYAFLHDKWCLKIHCKAFRVRNGFFISSNLKTISVCILCYVFLAFDTFLLLNLFAIQLLHAWT